LKRTLAAAVIAAFAVFAIALARARTGDGDDARVERVAAIADRVLPDPGDAAAVVDLRTGRVVLEHHREALERRMLPGSVMKLVTAHAILEAKRADDEVRCEGSHVDRFGTARSCWLHDGHGSMRLRTAIALSCNVWFYEQASHLSPSALLDAMTAFGLDPPRSPILSDRDLPDAAVGDLAGLEVTPRALLGMAARIATRGREAPDLKPEHLEAIAEGMAEAVRSGTLSEVFHDLDVAAKTGTAKKENSARTRGIVVGFLPKRTPAYAFVVVKDHGRGAVDAGPPARAIAERLLAR
jgi:cell division protein FtsI/penicillin-binding protein 2